MPPSTLNVEALYAALDRQRQQREQSWRELAHQLGLSPSTFTRMAQGARPDADALTALVTWLKMDLRDFTSGEQRPSHEEPDPPVAVASLLRSSSKVKPEHAEALDEAFSMLYKSIVGRSSGS